MNLSLLYEYLKLLNANQRAFFSSHYSLKEKTKKKDMLLLYKTLIKQKKFDENKIKQIFKSKNLARLTRRLYDIVEEYMLLFDSKSDKYAEIFNYIIRAKKQKQLGITERAEYLLIKAKKLAYEVEDLNYLAIIMKELSSIYLIKNDFQSLENLEIEKLPQITTELSQYFSFVKMRITLIQYGLKRPNEQVGKLFNKKELKLLELNKNELNSECFEQQLYLNSMYHLILRNTKKSYEYQLQSLIFYESNKNSANYNFTRHNNLLYNTLRTQINFNKLKEAKISLDKLKNLEDNPNHFINDRITAIYKFRKANGELMYYNVKENYEQIVTDEKKNNDIISLYEIYVSKPQVFTIRFFTGFAFFALKNYDKASDYFKYLLDDKQIKLRKDIEEVAQLMYLICIYELDKGTFAKSIFDATSRFLKLKTNVRVESICDQLIMDLIGKLLKPLMDAKAIKSLKNNYKIKFLNLSKENETERERIIELGVFYWL